MIAKKVPCMDHIYSNAVMSWSWLDKYGELIEPDTRKKEELFKSISGQVEILGLSPNNDEHLFLLLSQNPKVKSVGGNVCVMPGVTIGDGTVIGAGSFVTKDIPSGWLLSEIHAE